MSKPNPELPDDDVPELGDEFFDRARPAREVMPADFMAAVRNKGGRPRSDNPKVAVSIRLDREVVEHFRATGDGWQSRINATLKADIKARRA
jgi:uncharacterized protein (DUF4415 family)